MTQETTVFQHSFFKKFRYALEGTAKNSNRNRQTANKGEYL